MLQVDDGAPAADADIRRSFRSTASSTAVHRPSKVVRIRSIDSPMTHLRELRAHDAAEGAAHGTSEHRSAVFDQQALLYAIGLTLFGFVFPLSNYVSVRPISPWYLAAFYILLYSVSIVFLLFFLVWIIRQPAHILFLSPPEVPSERRKRPVVFHVGMADCASASDEDAGNCNAAFEETDAFQMSRTVAKAAAAGTACIELREPEATGSSDPAAAVAGDFADSVSVASSSRSSWWDPQATQTSCNSEVTAATASTAAAARRRRGMGERINSTLLQNAREFGVQEIPACSVLSLQESHSPSFFMRVACFIFGALKVTHEALMIVDTLTDVAGGCASSGSASAGLVIQYSLSICFTVLQTFVIFKYSKVSVNVYRKISVLGFMHLVATNMCVWFQAILLETSHSAYQAATKSAVNYSSSGNSTNSYSTNSYSTTATAADNSNAGRSCSKDVFWRMAPYLFPFTIEYALMAAFSSFTVYRNISKFLDVIQTKGFNVAKKCLRNRKRSQTSFSASCYKTDKGFFLGAFLLIIGLVSGIYFTVYVNDKPNDPVTSQLIYQITDLILLSANLVLCIIAYCQMRQLTLLHKVGIGPDSWLLGITLIGVLAFQLFQLLGSTSEVGASLGLRLAQGLLSITQSVFQVYLVLDGEKRRSKTEAAVEKKPGREMIAAVLLGNIALWIVYTLEIREISNLPNYSQAYVPVASNIFTYVCSPLIIFFRFHSSCCFVEIWRTAYKSKRRRCQSHPDLAACSTLPGSIHGLAPAGGKSDA